MTDKDYKYYFRICYAISGALIVLLSILGIFAMKQSASNAEFNILNSAINSVIDKNSIVIDTPLVIDCNSLKHLQSINSSQIFAIQDCAFLEVLSLGGQLFVNESLIKYNTCYVLENISIGKC